MTLNKEIRISGKSWERKNMDEKKIERLYKLLERAKKEHDTESEAALRWAIFNLERESR